MIYIDFECYFDSDYTLKKMSIPEYVRDPRFKIHGAAIKVDHHQAIYYRDTQLPAALTLLDFSHGVCAHHLQFDGFILSEIFGIHSSLYTCTLSMARYVHQGDCDHDLGALMVHHGLGHKPDTLQLLKGKRILTEAEHLICQDYCLGDVEGCYQLAQIFVPQMPSDELRLIHITMQMMIEPVLVLDHERAKRAHQEELDERAALVASTGLTVKELRKNEAFSAKLAEYGVATPTKPSPKNPAKQIPALAKNDQGMQALLEHDDQRVVNLCLARLAVKSTTSLTRAERFIRITEGGKTLPVYLKYWAAGPGRWGGGDKTNMQNLKRGSELRKSLRAPEGYVLVVADSAQIEARIVAYIADQNDLVHAFRNKRDVYSEFASKKYGRPVDRKKRAEDYIAGFVGKVCILGLGFGMGGLKLASTLSSGAMGERVPTTAEEGHATVALYRHENAMIAALWKKTKTWLLIMMNGLTTAKHKFLEFGNSRIKMPNGTEIRYTNLEADFSGGFTYQKRPGVYVRTYGAKIVENYTQGSARAVVAEQMLKIAERYRIVTMSHDEIVSLARIQDADEALAFSIATMKTPPTWAPDLPLDAEGDWDECYSK